MKISKKSQETYHRNIKKTSIYQEKRLVNRGLQMKSIKEIISMTIVEEYKGKCKKEEKKVGKSGPADETYL